MNLFPTEIISRVGKAKYASPKSRNYKLFGGKKVYLFDCIFCKNFWKVTMGRLFNID